MLQSIDRHITEGTCSGGINSTLYQDKHWNQVTVLLFIASH